MPAILDLYQIPYTFSDPLVAALTLHKGLTKAVVRDAGLPTADFAVVERIEDVARRRLAAAAVRQAGGRRDRQGHHGGLEDPRPAVAAADLRANCWPGIASRCWSRRFLPGREFTVGIAGTGPEARGARQHGGAAPARGRGRGLFLCRTRSSATNFAATAWAGRTQDEEVRQAEALALAAYRVLGCRDAGRVDIRSDAQRQPHFIEVNPLAGLHPVHSDLPILCGMKGISYADVDRANRPLRRLRRIGAKARRC